MRVLHQPRTIVGVENHVGGEQDPLRGIGRRRILTIPDSGLRKDGDRIAHAVLIELDGLLAVPFGKTAGFRQRVVPVDIGIGG